MSSNGSALVHLTFCRLCNPKEEITHGTEVGPPIIGETPNKKRMKYYESLKAHLAKEHRDKVVGILGAGQEFMEYMGSLYFETSDPSVQRDMERIRAVAFRTMRKNWMPDEVIDGGVEKLKLDPEDTALVQKFCKAMRDALCEEGQYQHEIFRDPAIMQPGPKLVV